MDYKEYQELKRFEKEVEVKTLEGLIEHLGEIMDKLQEQVDKGESRVDALSLLIDIEADLQSKLRNTIAEKDKAYNIK